MNNKMEEMWKEVIVADFKALPQITYTRMLVYVAQLIFFGGWWGYFMMSVARQYSVEW